MYGSALTKREQAVQPKPNLFIIGAAKSGTTSLHHALAGHPDIFMSDPKEPGFFVPELTYYPSDEAWYLSLFEDAGTLSYRGESSTHYTKLPLYPGVPQRIAEFVDEPPRFIYLVRDPLDRAVSHYWHNVRKLQEHRSIGEALRDRIEYTAFSDYRMQLEPYFEWFGRQDVLILTFEQLRDRPGEVLANTLEWLGVSALADITLGKKNQRPESFLGLRGRGALDRLARTRIWNALSPLVPQWIKEQGKNLSYRRADPDVSEIERIKQELRPRMQDRVRDLEQFLDRTFPEWSSTWDTGAAEPT